MDPFLLQVGNSSSFGSNVLADILQIQLTQKLLFNAKFRLIDGLLILNFTDDFFFLIGELQ